MKPLRTLLINRNYARLWYGQAVSTVGDYVFDTTLVLWVATVLARGRSWAPVAVSGLLLSVGAAVLLVGPLAGVFVDRWNRQATMLRTEVLRALLAGALAILSLLPGHALPTWLWLTVIYTTVFILNAAGQFFSPARFATVGDIVQGDVDRTRAAGIGQATIAVASIIGPPLAAPLLFTIGVQWALAVNAASYLFSYFAIRSVRLSGSDGLAAGEPAKAGLAGVRAEFAAGVRVFFGSRFLRTLLGIAVIAQCGTGALNTLGIFFVTSDLHAPARLYGFMATAFGIGALIGSLWAGRVARWFGPRTMTALGLAVAGALVLAYARQSYFAAAVVLLGLVAVPVAMLNTALTPLLLKATPPEYLGRVIAVFNPLNQLASMLSVIVAGWLASNVLRTFSATLLGMRFGPIDTIFTAAGVLLLLSGGYAYLALPREKLAGEAAVEPASVPTSG